MKISLDEISDIRFGFYAQPEEGGDLPYLQVRQFNEQGILRGVAEESIFSDQKSSPYLLKDGDVLFVGKGNRLFAWCYRDAYGPYVASSIFFIIRPNQKAVYPEYLAAVLNTPQVKTAFLQLGAGTNIFSIRKSELGAFEIPLPPMEKQIKIAALSELFQREIALTHDLLNQKQQLFSGIISILLK